MFHTHDPPWVNKHGQIQLNARYARNGMLSRIIISVRTRAAHNGVPPSDRWDIVAVHPIEDMSIDARELAKGYVRMHATLMGHPHLASYDGFANGDHDVD